MYKQRIHRLVRLTLTKSFLHHIFNYAHFAVADPVARGEGG